MIYVVLGTKAQLIKMAPVIRLLQERDFSFRFIHTGQHKETMKEMYRDFGLKDPDIYLYSGEDITSIFKITYWFIAIFFKSITMRKMIFPENNKSVVIIHGDTFSTLYGALIGRLFGFEVAHIESGLRSFRLFHPFPEEITRLLVFRLSSILYCPGAWAMENVKKYNKRIVNTQGNTLIDTIAISKNADKSEVTDNSEQFGLVSLHRYENIFKKNQLEKIVSFLEMISSHHKLIFILHVPTRKQLIKFQLIERLRACKNIELEKRLSHPSFLRKLLDANFVITDGGSLQEETSYLGIPCLLFREATEREEGIGKNVILSKFDEKIITHFVNNFNSLRREEGVFQHSPSEIIVDDLKGYG